MLQAVPLVITSLQSIPWDAVRVATSCYDNMVKLVDMIESGIPESRNLLPLPIRDFYQFRDDLHTVDGVVLYKAGSSYHLLSGQQL